MTPRVVVTRRIPQPALDLLAASTDLWVSDVDAPMPREELHRVVSWADAVVTLLHDRVDDAFLDAAGTQLQIVSNVAVGYDNIDVPACAARGVLVSNTPAAVQAGTSMLS